LQKVVEKESAKPKMSIEDRIFLEEQYRNDVKELQVVLGRELPWNLSTSNKRS